MTVSSMDLSYVLKLINAALENKGLQSSADEVKQLGLDACTAANLSMIEAINSGVKRIKKNPINALAMNVEHRKLINSAGVDYTLLSPDDYHKVLTERVDPLPVSEPKLAALGFTSIISNGKTYVLWGNL